MVPLAASRRNNSADARLYVSNELVAGNTPDWAALDAFADAISGIDYYLERLCEDAAAPGDEILSVVERSLTQLGYGAGSERALRPAAPVVKLRAGTRAGRRAAAAAGGDAGRRTKMNRRRRSGGGAGSGRRGRSEEELMDEVPEEAPRTDRRANVRTRGRGRGAARAEPGREARRADGGVRSGHRRSGRSLHRRRQHRRTRRRSVRSEQSAVRRRARSQRSRRRRVAPRRSRADATSVNDAQPKAPSARAAEAARRRRPHGTPPRPRGTAGGRCCVRHRRRHPPDLRRRSGEVLERVDQWLPQWAAEFSNEEALTEIRRAFHTLKGSGRIVGANVIGELAWSIENMLNRVMDGTVEPNQQIAALTREARIAVPALCQAFESRRPVADSSDRDDHGKGRRSRVRRTAGRIRRAKRRPKRRWFRFAVRRRWKRSPSTSCRRPI